MSDTPQSRLPSRREFMVLGTGIFAVAAVGGAGVWQRRQLVRRAVPVMGTVAEIAVVTRDPRAAHAALDAAFAELHAVDRLMTRFSSASDVGRANTAASRSAVPVSAGTAAVVGEALRWAAVRESRFDPCIGRASELWDVTRRSEPPSQADVQRLARRGLYHALELGRSGGEHVLVYHEPDVALDLGGIAKGYAVDRAVVALRDWGVTDALVNAGGDLYAMGTSAERDPWRVGVRSPAEPSRIAFSFALEDRAVATSGDYEQYFEHGGRRYHHLLDPATAAPRVAFSHSLTVAADTCMSADAAATAAFGLPQAIAHDVVRSGEAGALIVQSG
jgi:FAD:protein FMN transferase